jgi:hypothetical protein
MEKEIAKDKPFYTYSNDPVQFAISGTALNTSVIELAHNVLGW